MMNHWTPQNQGIEVAPTSQHTLDPAYDPLVEPAPAQLVALVSDVALMSHTRKMGVFRPVFETLSTLGLNLDTADPVGFLEFPQTERDIVIVLAFDCDATSYPPRDEPTIADGQRDFIDQYRMESPVILDISIAGVFIQDHETESETVAGTTLHLDDDLPMRDFLLPLSPYAITSFGYPTLQEWSASTLIGYTQNVLDQLVKVDMERLFWGQPKRTSDRSTQLRREYERVCTLLAQAHQELTQ